MSAAIIVARCFVALFVLVGLFSVAGVIASVVKGDWALAGAELLGVTSMVVVGSEAWKQAKR